MSNLSNFSMASEALIAQAVEWWQAGNGLVLDARYSEAEKQEIHHRIEGLLKAPRPIEYHKRIFYSRESVQ
jgi:hypothetical protein